MIERFFGEEKKFLKLLYFVFLFRLFITISRLFPRGQCAFRFLIKFKVGCSFNSPRRVSPLWPRICSQVRKAVKSRAPWNWRKPSKSSKIT